MQARHVRTMEGPPFAPQTMPQQPKLQYILVFAREFGTGNILQNDMLMDFQGTPRGRSAQEVEALCIDSGMCGHVRAGAGVDRAAGVLLRPGAGRDALLLHGPAAAQRRHRLLPLRRRRPGSVLDHRLSGL